MNKRLHRVVFNAARGLRVVVQETARRAGGATVVVGLVAAAPAAGQIVGAPNVPGNLRPTVLVAPNAVPLVNIQTPSAAGVSRNVYSQFDVQRNGVILNNSRTAVQTQLGGFVQGNPWLARGPARIVLNEINSGTPSQIRGYVEVGGQKAEVIIANPAGIAVDGGGFVNASRATLTTGTPQLNARGGLENFVVRGGTVNVDHFDNTGGTLRAGNLNITATGDLINRDGKLESDRDATLSVGGVLLNTRGTVSAAGATTLHSQALDNSKGSIRSIQGSTRLAVANRLQNDDGSITAGRHTTIAAGSLQSGGTGVLGAGIQADGSLGSVGDLRVTTTDALVATFAQQYG